MKIQREYIGTSNKLRVISTNGSHGAHQGFSVEPGETYTFEIDLHRPAGMNKEINVVIWKNTGPSGALSVHFLNVDGTNTFTYNATSSDIFIQIRQEGTYYLDNEVTNIIYTDREIINPETGKLYENEKGSKLTIPVQARGGEVTTYQWINPVHMLSISEGKLSKKGDGVLHATLEAYIGAVQNPGFMPKGRSGNGDSSEEYDSAHESSNNINKFNVMVIINEDDNFVFVSTKLFNMREVSPRINLSGPTVTKTDLEKSGRQFNKNIQALNAYIEISEKLNTK